MTPKVSAAPARGAGKNSSIKVKGEEKPVLIEPVPMRPRRGLLVLLSIVFACWVGWLLAMYFTTVRRNEHLAPTSAPSLAVASPSMPAGPVWSR